MGINVLVIPRGVVVRKATSLWVSGASRSVVLVVSKAP